MAARAGSAPALRSGGGTGENESGTGFDPDLSAQGVQLATLHPEADLREFVDLAGNVVGHGPAPYGTPGVGGPSGIIPMSNPTKSSFLPAAGAIELVD